MACHTVIHCPLSRISRSKSRFHCVRIQRTVWEDLGHVLGIMMVTELEVVILPVNRLQ